MSRFFLLTVTAIFTLAGNLHAEEAEPGLDKAIALFKAAKTNECIDSAFDDDHVKIPDIHHVTYRSDYASAGEPDTKITLFQFFCDFFPHARSTVFIRYDADKGKHVSLLSFPFPFGMPDPEAKTEDPAWTLIGFGTQDSLQNAEFDPATRMLTTTNFSGNQEFYATYALKEGIFVFIGNEQWEIKGGNLVRTVPPDVE